MPVTPAPRRRSRRFLAVSAAVVGVVIGGTAMPGPAAAWSPLPPQIKTITPSSGPPEGGNPVMLGGPSLSDLRGVRFGDSYVSPGDVRFESATVLAPEGRAGTVVDVVALDYDGRPTGAPVQYTYEGRTRYPVQASPGRGRPSGGQTVTVTGTNIDFRTVKAVRFGPNAATLGARTSSSIVVTSPAGTPGAAVELTVETSNGEIEGQVKDRFTYDWSANPPSITKIEPATGYATGSEYGTITGTGLRGATQVTIDGKPVYFSEVRDSAMAVDEARLSFGTSPHAPGTVDIQVTTPVGTSPNTAADDYTFLPVPGPPEITRLVPDKAFVGERREVTAYGRNLVKVDIAWFGATRAPYWAQGTDTQVPLGSPIVGTPGKVDVRVQALGGTNDLSGTADDFTFVPVSPVLVTPQDGRYEAGALVTLSNDAFGFEYIDTVKFGSSVAPIVDRTPTSLVVRAPGGPVGETVPIELLSGGSYRRNTTGEQWTWKAASEPRSYRHAAKGTVAFSRLTTGTPPINGGVDLVFDDASAAVKATVALGETQARLITPGAIPVTARIAFVGSGTPRASVSSDGTLEVTANYRVKVREAKLFGAVPLETINGCQSKSLVQLGLRSAPQFDPAVGGTLTSTFAMSDLNGCTVLEGLVSPLTASADNTISLALTPKG